MTESQKQDWRKLEQQLNHDQIASTTIILNETYQVLARTAEGQVHFYPLKRYCFPDIEQKFGNYKLKEPVCSEDLCCLTCYCFPLPTGPVERDVLAALISNSSEDKARYFYVVLGVFLFLYFSNKILSS